jgi:hypothetical protein
MKAFACEFEAEVLAAALESRLAPDLREHAGHCSICSEVASLVPTFALARQEAHARAAVPDASRIWWMAQLRARREAVTDASRPILATQIAALVWAIGLIVVCLGAALAWFQATRVWMESLLLTHGVLIALCAATVLVLPTVAYFAIGKE